MRYAVVLLLVLATVAGCGSAPRRPAPPRVISGAVPDGYSSSVRLLTTDVEQFARRSPEFFQGIHDSAGGGTVDILALSGGGAGGAFGVGVLTGMTRAHNRPQYELVTGVSVGALLAPFAYLGSDWDGPMYQAFGGDSTAHLLGSPKRALFARLLSPMGYHHGALFKLVDHFVTPEMIAAVARENAKGRRLVVGTTDLDKQESVLWDMGEIAARGGEPAREMFRDVLVASASVPGMFPPVLIHVHDGDQHYDELHVDGSVTAPVFTGPMIAELRPDAMPQLRGAHLYMIVNGQLHRFPKTTPVKTMAVLIGSFGSGLVYKTREAVAETVGFARAMDIRFEIAEIPADYPMGSFIDFDAKTLESLFNYAADCAAAGRVWVTPEQGLKRSFMASGEATGTPPACPADNPTLAPKSAVTGKP